MPLWRDIKGTCSGLGVTLRSLFRTPVTIEYPDEKRTPHPRFRGRMILTRSPDGQERCVACQLCSAACPVDCIAMQSAEDAQGRRYAAWFRINFSRCIFCGLCAEACPTLAIQMTTAYEFSQRTLDTLIWEKEDLLVDHGGSDPEYDFYRHAGIGVLQPRGSGAEEDPPGDVKSNLP